MKKLLLVAVFAIATLFASVTPAEASLCCKKQEVCTVEVCRSYSCKEKKCFCKTKVTQYVTINYCTTYVDCNGCHSTKEWSKTKKVSVCWR